MTDSPSTYLFRNEVTQAQISHLLHLCTHVYGRILVYMNGKVITYYRVSTARQGESGLGLEAQQDAVSKFLNGGEWELSGEFVEVESGRKKNRPQLLAALKQAKAEKATLVIAKLDRLARNVHFISGLIESGVDFVAVDNPHANKMLVQMMAVFAEFEADAISKRTKEALAAAKARGVELGKHGKVLAAQNKVEAQGFAESIRSEVENARDAGFTSIRALASELNRRKVSTARGGEWHTTSVARLLKRLQI